MPLPDLITYRYNGTLVYVLPAQSYEEGIALVQASFDELSNVDADHITICVNAMVGGKRTHIRIGPAAWSKVLPLLARYEVLDIIVKNPKIVVDSADTPPTYEDVKANSGSETLLLPSRGPTPQNTPKHKTATLSQYFPGSHARLSPASMGSSWTKGHIFNKRSH
ncbi:hypothetical protein C8Q80DRAFT_1149499 [Daedaleopsis nitida]|nr:hypothetical protein C8Q80DRAFT_1149499 [Daedaleopsis nitida]